MRVRVALVAGVLSVVCAIAVALSTRARDGSQGALRAENGFTLENYVYALCTKNSKILSLCLVTRILQVGAGGEVVCRLAKCANARVAYGEEYSGPPSKEMIQQAEKEMEGDVGDVTSQEASSMDVFQDGQMLFLVKDSAALDPPEPSMWASASNGAFSDLPEAESGSTFSDVFGDMQVQYFDSSDTLSSMEQDAAGQTKTAFYEVGSEGDSVFNFVKFQDSTYGTLFPPKKAESMLEGNKVDVDFILGLEESQKSAGIQVQSEAAPEEGNSFFPDSAQYFKDGDSIGPKEYRRRPLQQDARAGGSDDGLDDGEDSESSAGGSDGDSDGDSGDDDVTAEDVEDGIINGLDHLLDGF